jgi:ABC-type antimicrobial peptide transport system permease subunit
VTSAEARRLVMREAGLLVGVGLALGLIGVLATRGAVARIAFQAQATDPSTLLLCAGLLIASGLIACWVPVVRATRVAPAEALRID